MAKPRVSELTANRLSLYLRFLTQIEEPEDATVSSRAMADALGVTSAQVRRDLASFGAFGVRGVGYDVQRLRAELERILGLDRTLRVVIVGAGNLGNALADYPGFGGRLEVVALFDIDPDKVGNRTRGGIPIHHLDDLERVTAGKVDVGIVSVPAGAAQGVVDALVAAGIRGVLNFAPTRPRVPEGFRCKSVDLTLELESLSFFLAGGVTEAVE
ncbi:MAG: redox-sensing transcriptional repressor Rex [Acidobacteriota bacterium]|jgi:redox-sensing transcriptional repressor